jgi:hypothetical protein
MRIWRLVGGVVLVCAACGGATGSVSLDAAAPVATTDAHPGDPGSDAGSDGPAPVVDGSAVDGSGGDAAPPAPTWSAIYSQFFANPSYPSNCLGSGCHAPGTQKGIDFSTADKGWSSIHHRVTPGMPDASELISVLRSGYMPQGRPKMPAADVSQISAWIAAGAQND